MPPKDKRALFSLNLDTDADHVYQKITEHNDKGEESVRVIESKGPTHGHSDLSYVTRPFQKTVNRAVNEVVEGSGKKVHSAEGSLSYSTTRTERRGGKEEDDRERRKINVVSKIKRRNIERKYDTSEL